MTTDSLLATASTLNYALLNASQIHATAWCVKFWCEDGTRYGEGRTLPEALASALESEPYMPVVEPITTDTSTLDAIVSARRVATPVHRRVLHVG